MNASTDLQPPAAMTETGAGHLHLVQFYESDAVLVESVAKYLREGLESGAAALMIATAEHEAQVVAHWKEQGFDTAAARERGQFVTLDAAQTLSRLLVDGWPDAERFEAVIGKQVAEANRRFGGVVAFGEMVGLLWAQGRADAAIGLEGLWNELATRQKFLIYFGYRLRDCAQASDSGPFKQVCDAHSHVVPGESCAVPPGEREHARIVALLQQKASALEREIELRKRIEAQLADRERELSDLVENAVYAMHKVGPDGTILWANPAELELLGYDPDEYLGRNIAEFHVDSGSITRVLRRLAAGETIRDHPAKLMHKDGSVRHVLISSNALLEEGRLVSTRCFTRDISDRWLAQEALRERGAVLHLAMQGARMGYWVYDLERDSIRCSHELAGLFGLSGAVDWPLDKFLALVHPEDRPAFRRSLQSSVDSRSVFVNEFRVRPEMGDWRWFEGRGEAVYDEGSAPSRFYGVCTDVTLRKRRDQMLAHLAAVVDSADDAIVSKTLDGIVTSWNPGAARLFGYQSEEIVGRPITTIIPPELHYEEANILARVKAGERVEHYRTTRVAKNGVRKTVSITVSPIRDASGRIVGASKIGREVKAVE